MRQIEEPDLHPGRDASRYTDRDVRPPRWQLLPGAAAVVLLLALHCLPRAGGVDPVHDLLSEYPLRSVGVGVLYAVALLNADLAAGLLGIAMVRRGLLRGWLELALLVVWCVSLLGLTVFLKDPAGSAGTWYGAVHEFCTVANFASLPALCALLCWRFRTTPRWHRFTRTVGALAAVSIACVVPFAVAFLLDRDGLRAHDTALGLVERGIVAIDVAVLATMTLWSRAALGSGPRGARG